MIDITSLTDQIYHNKEIITYNYVAIRIYNKTYSTPRECLIHIPPYDLSWYAIRDRLNWFFGDMLSEENQQSDWYSVELRNANEWWEYELINVYERFNGRMKHSKQWRGEEIDV